MPLIVLKSLKLVCFNQDPVEPIHFIFHHVSLKSLSVTYSPPVLTPEETESSPVRFATCWTWLFVLMVLTFSYLVVRAIRLVYSGDTFSKVFLSILFLASLLHAYSLLHWVRKYVMPDCLTCYDTKIYQRVQVLSPWPFSWLVSPEADYETKSWV